MEFSLSSLLFDRAARDPERSAVIAPELTISYGEIAAEAAGFAALLRERGLAGERIAMLLPNIARFASVYYGILAAEGSVVMLNPVNSPREIEEQLHDSGARAVVTLSGLRPHLPPGARALLADGLPDAVQETLGDEAAATLQLDPSPPFPGALPGGSREAAIIFTAAESGRARGAVLSHRNLIANLHSTMEMMRLDEQDRMVAALPQVHAFGMTVGLNAAIAAGAAIVPMERFHPVRALELLTATNATVFSGVPAMFQGMLASLDRHPVPKHALRITLSGGAPIHSSVQARWEEVFGIPLREGYGLTEASPVCLFNGPQYPNRPGTLGYPVPRVDVSIQDDDGSVLPDGEVGEICVRGENVFGGYLHETSLSPPYFRGEWLRTGDLGSRDADGCFRFRGLLKPMFTRSGFNVYPHEVERALSADPRIARARVSAQPDPARENEIILEVEPAPGTLLTEDDVRDICKARLAAYKQPGRIVILP